MKTFKYLQLNADLAEKKKGTVIRIECVKVTGKDKKTRYIPKERYWRDRIRDSAVDKCVEFVDKPGAKSEDSKATKPKK